MEDEIEDLVGDVKYTDSQKSVATSNVYSLDFADCSSDLTDQNYSSGKETYVIERYDSDDSDTTFHTNNNNKCIDQIDAPIKLNHDENIQCDSFFKINNSSSANLKKCAILAQETYTQTSKTIIELATLDSALRKSTKKTLETQTSFISITQNKTVKYVEFTEADAKLHKKKVLNNTNSEINANDSVEIMERQLFNHSIDHMRPQHPPESEDIDSDTHTSQIFRVVDQESKENSIFEIQNEGHYENTSDFEEDSLMGDTSNVATNEENNSNGQLSSPSDSYNTEDRVSPVSITQERNLGVLSPLTEESVRYKESQGSTSPDLSLVSTRNKVISSDVIFKNDGINIKVLPQEGNNFDGFKLPPIVVNHSCPNSPHFNYLLSITTPRTVFSKAGTLPCLYEGQNDEWNLESNDLASGEGAVKSIAKEKQNLDSLLLPPIFVESQYTKNISHNKDNQPKTIQNLNQTPQPIQNSISIERRIKELKISNNNPKQLAQFKYNGSTAEIKTSRSCSPISESRLGDIGLRGCEMLCSEVLRRLRSESWVAVSETLNDTPRVLEKFWGVVTEQRIADLIRQVSAHVESPRTQVARTACNTLASIIKNTNYTKKPDFYEAVSVLLTKTGSFSRPVRRAANVALDDIVCGVQLSHAVAALCVHGVDHKSQLVRCAVARLLVVACALASGGRELLRTRPPSAATARRHALQALAMFLDDKNVDARKYAERLYSMLRPLENFEAFYLTDVDLEVASRQMKKYDQLLLFGSSKAPR